MMATYRITYVDGHKQVLDAATFRLDKGHYWFSDEANGFICVVAERYVMSLEVGQ